MQVPWRTACAMMGESLLRQNCSHGYLSESAVPKSVLDHVSGHLQYAVCRSNTSFRPVSWASGGLSFNCAAESVAPLHSLIPSAPWETWSKCELAAWYLFKCIQWDNYWQVLLNPMAWTSEIWCANNKGTFHRRITDWLGPNLFWLITSNHQKPLVQVTNHSIRLTGRAS